MEDPRIPSIPDPFDLKDCAQLPFPLTPTEDHILKHILRICGSDQQMALRAYDSIICMWAKKEQGQAPPCIAPVATLVEPTTVNVADVGGNFIQLKIYGTDIQPGANILYKGLVALNPSQGENVTGKYVSATLDFIDTSKFKSGPIPVQLINPSKTISNSLSLQVTLIPA